MCRNSFSFKSRLALFSWGLPCTVDADETHALNRLQSQLMFGLQPHAAPGRISVREGAARSQVNVVNLHVPANGRS